MPNIIGARINWMDGYGNDPTIQLFLDAEPVFTGWKKAHMDAGGVLSAEQTPIVGDDPLAPSNAHMYMAEDGPLVRFYAYDGPSTGFGGSRFKLTMHDGTEEILVGPWSGNSRGLERAFGIKTVECSYQVGDPDNPGSTFYAGCSIKEDDLRKAVAEFCPGVEVIPATYACFTFKWADRVSKQTYQLQASEAWQEIRKSNPDINYKDDAYDELDEAHKKQWPGYSTLNAGAHA